MTTPDRNTSDWYGYSGDVQRFDDLKGWQSNPRLPFVLILTAPDENLETRLHGMGINPASLSTTYSATFPTANLPTETLPQAVETPVPKEPEAIVQEEDPATVLEVTHTSEDKGQNSEDIDESTAHEKGRQGRIVTEALGRVATGPWARKIAYAALLSTVFVGVGNHEFYKANSDERNAEVKFFDMKEMPNPFNAPWTAVKRIGAIFP